jgi:hypothetical protein
MKDNPNGKVNNRLLEKTASLKQFDNASPVNYFLERKLKESKRE